MTDALDALRNALALPPETPPDAIADALEARAFGRGAAAAPINAAAAAIRSYQAAATLCQRHAGDAVAALAAT